MTKEGHELTKLALIDRQPASELGKPQWSIMDKATCLEIKKRHAKNAIALKQRQDVITKNH